MDEIRSCLAVGGAEGLRNPESCAKLLNIRDLIQHMDLNHLINSTTDSSLLSRIFQTLPAASSGIERIRDLAADLYQYQDPMARAVALRTMRFLLLTTEERQTFDASQMDDETARWFVLDMAQALRPHDAQLAQDFLASIEATNNSGGEAPMTEQAHEQNEDGTPPDVKEMLIDPELLEHDVKSDETSAEAQSPDDSQSADQDQPAAEEEKAKYWCPMCGGQRKTTRDLISHFWDHCRSNRRRWEWEQQLKAGALGPWTKEEARRRGKTRQSFPKVTALTDQKQWKEKRIKKPVEAEREGQLADGFTDFDPSLYNLFQKRVEEDKKKRKAEQDKDGEGGKKKRREDEDK